jgi:hypothetical protein
MLLEHEDMDVDQRYHRENHMRHIAELHGFGTVCGLKVEFTDCSHEIIIRKGVAIDCLGREIRVEKDVKVNLEKEVREAVAERRAKPIRLEMEEERRDDDDGDPDKRPVHLYVTLCYHEERERPLQSLGGPETCCEPSCEMSRIVQGFRVEISRHPPKNPHDVDGFIKELEHCQHARLKDFLCEFITEKCRTCVPDPCGREHHCVCIARVEAWPTGEVGEVDNCGCRQLVLSTTMLAGLARFALARTGRP